MNEPLRRHVTRVGFDLTLGKTHIATLVHINEELKRNKDIMTGGRRNVFSMFVTAARGLEERGLLEWKRKSQTKDLRAPREVWKITKAGELVIGLLKEAGLYGEYQERLVEEEHYHKERTA